MYSIKPCSLAAFRIRAASFLLLVWGLAFLCHRHPSLHFVVSIILPIIFGSYAIFLIFNSYRTRNSPQVKSIDKDLQLPFLSIIVPAKDEASVLPRLCESISRVDYPSHLLQVIVVNDASRDTSRTTLTELRKAYPWLLPVHLDSPTGSKSGAMNAGYDHINKKAEIVGYLDADATLSKEVFRGVVEVLQDGRVAAVQAPKCVNPAFCDSLLGKMQFWEMLLDAAFQQARCAGGGVPDLHGDGEFIRREILDALGGNRAWNQDSLTDDLDMTIRLSLLGYRIKYLSNWFAILEEPVYTWTQFVDQRRRWVMGGYQRFHDYLTQILSPPYHTVYELPDLSIVQSSLNSDSLSTPSPNCTLNSKIIKTVDESKEITNSRKSTKPKSTFGTYTSPLQFWMLKYDLIMCMWAQYFWPIFWLADWTMAFYHKTEFVGYYLEKVYLIVTSSLVAPLYWRSGTIATWNYQLLWMMLTPVIGSTLMIVVAFVSFDTIIHPRSIPYTKSDRASDRSRPAPPTSNGSLIPWQYAVPVILVSAWMFYIFSGQLPRVAIVATAIVFAVGAFIFARI